VASTGGMKQIAGKDGQGTRSEKKGPERRPKVVQKKKNKGTNNAGENIGKRCNLSALEQAGGGTGGTEERAKKLPGGGRGAKKDKRKEG